MTDEVNNMNMVTYVRTLNSVLWKPLKVNQRPIHIQLEPTTYCNLNCRSCGHVKYLEHSTHLTPEHFTRIVEQIRPIKVSFSGSGEPFMNPHLFRFIRQAKEQGISINTTSNCTLFTSALCEQIVKSGLDLIKISIDGATSETYRKNRGEDRFLQVLDGIRTLTETKKRLGSLTPFIRFNYVISNYSYQEMAETIELAQRMEVDAIYFQPLELNGIEERQTSLVGDVTSEKLFQEILRAIETSRRHQVQTNLSDIHRKLPLYWRKYQLETQQQKRICPLPWFSAYVTHNGMVRPCCTCFQSSTNMGNLLEQDIDELWNGEKYQWFRQEIRTGKRPFDVCKNCVPRTLTDIVRYSKILPGFLR